MPRDRISKKFELGFSYFSFPWFLLFQIKRACASSMSSSKLAPSSATLNGEFRIHIQSILDITVMCIEGLYFICTYMTSDDYTSFEEEIPTQHWRACSAGGERSVSFSSPVLLVLKCRCRVAQPSVRRPRDQKKRRLWGREWLRRGREEKAWEQATSFPGYSLYFEKVKRVPWERGWGTRCYRLCHSVHAARRH